MSIYPVRLAKWFFFGDEYFESAYSTVKHTRCLACGAKVRYSKAVDHHSLPWGYGDLFCSWKCCRSGKIAKPDKRRERRMRRKYGKYESALIDVILTDIWSKG